MGPRAPTRRQIIGWLAVAAEQAEHAEIYHTAAINPEVLDDRLAHQAAVGCGGVGPSIADRSEPRFAIGEHGERPYPPANYAPETVIRIGKNIA
jgi:hypothetical protein